MLDHLVGTEGLPSSDLIRDLRALFSLEDEQVKQFAAAFASVPEEQSEKSFSELLLESLKLLECEPEKLSSIVGVARFLWERWAQLRLRKDQVEADLKSIGITDAQLVSLAPLLDIMGKRITVIQRRRAEASALGTGTPQIDSAVCAIDGRAVFESARHEESAGDEQPYFALERFVPIVILEIVSKLNGEQDTQSYLLTERTLSELIDILDRAKRRLEVVKKRL